MKYRKIEIFIVDDHPTVRMGLNRLLEQNSEFHVCGEASTANETITAIGRINPDVVLIDLSLQNDMSGLELIKALKDRYPDVITVVHSMYDEMAYAERSIRAGASGYIQKNQPPEHVIEMIRITLKGGLAFSDQVKDRMLERYISQKNTPSETDNLGSLTNREVEVFRLMGKGSSIKEIASTLGLSLHTIESHRRNIREKLNINNNSQLIKAAVDWVSCTDK